MGTPEAIRPVKNVVTPNRSKLGILFEKSGRRLAAMAAVCLATLLSQSTFAPIMARAQSGVGNGAPPPAVRFLTADPAPLSALSTLLAAGNTVTDSVPNCPGAPAAGCQPAIAPEIRELARGLRYDPALIFAYVHDRIGVHPVFGASKGALGTLIDQNGSSFDQAMLAADLLRASNGKPAGSGAINQTLAVEFRVGTVSLTGSQFAAWTGFTEARAACEFLGAGGFPATVNGVSTCASLSGPVTSVVMGHAWLSVSVNGAAPVDWDVAFKSHTWNAGLNLTSLSGIDSLDPVNSASGGSTSGAAANGAVPWAQGFSYASLDGDLRSRAAQLHAALSADVDTDYRDSVNRPIRRYALTLEQVVGLETIQPRVATDPLSPLTSGASSQGFNNIPDQFRTKLTLVVGYNSLLGSAPLYADEFSGRQFVIQTGGFGGLNNYHFDLQLRVEGQIVREYHGTEGPPGRDVGVTWTIDHPYPAQNGQYADETIGRPLELITDAVIVAGFGETSPSLGGKLSAILGHERAVPWFIGLGATGEEEPVDAARGDNQRHGIAASWLAQMSRMAKLQAALARSRLSIHHQIGFVSAHTTMSDGAVVTIGDESLHIDVSSSLSATGLSSAAAVGPSLRKSIATSAATLESSVFQQQNDAPDVSSTVERFAWATAPSNDPNNLQTDTGGRYGGPYKFYVFDSSNIGSLTEGLFTYSGRTNCYGELSVQPDPANPDLCTLKSVVPYVTWLVNAGYRVVLAKETFLGPGLRCGRKKSLIRLSVPTSGPAQNQCPQNHKRGFGIIAFNDDGSRVVHLNVSATGLFEATDSKGGGATAYQELLGGARAATSADLIKYRSGFGTGAAISPASGDVSISTGVLVSAGQGDFPYSLSYERSYSSARVFRPWEESSVWTDTFQIGATVSGSGLESMGASRMLNAVPSLITFMAMQKAYSGSVSGADSVKREVSGALIGKWWADQISANVVSISRGSSVEQFVRRPDGGFNPPAGAISQLQQTGNRTLEFAPTRLQGYPTERRWKYQSVAFTLTSGEKDQLTLSFMPKRPLGDPDFPEVTGVGTLAPSWSASSWSFPSGVALSFSYTGPPAGYTGTATLLSSVTNNLGVGLNFGYAATGFANGSADFSLASVAATGGSQALFSQSPEGDVHSVTKPDGSVVKFTFLKGEFPLVADGSNNVAPQNAAFFAENGGDGRPGFRKLLTSISTGRDVATAQSSPTYKVMYDYEGRGKWIDVAQKFGSDRGYRRAESYIGGGWRAEQRNPSGASTVSYFDDRGQTIAALDPINRKGTAEYDGLGRIITITSPWGDRGEYTYDTSHNVTFIRRVARPSAPEGQQVAEVRAEYANIAFPTKPTRICQTPTRSAGSQAIDPDTSCDLFHGHNWHEFTYSARGQLESMTLPRTFDGKTGQSA